MATAKDTASNFISDLEEKFEKLMTTIKDKLSGNDEVTDAHVLQAKQSAAAGLANLVATVDTSGANVPLDPDAKVPNTNATGSDTINTNSGQNKSGLTETGASSTKDTDSKSK